MTKNKRTEEQKNKSSNDNDADCDDHHLQKMTKTKDDKTTMLIAMLIVFTTTTRTRAINKATATPTRSNNRDAAKTLRIQPISLFHLILRGPIFKQENGLFSYLKITNIDEQQHAQLLQEQIPPTRTVAARTK